MNSHVLKAMTVEGDRKINWQNYKKMFIKYIDENSSEIDDSKKISILLHFAGDHCKDLYENVLEFGQDEDKEILETVLEKFDCHFACDNNVSYQRHLFFSRKQRLGEMYDEYVQTLNRLSENCGFGTLKESLVRDRFISGIRNNSIKNMLLKLPDIDLDFALNICKENSVKCEIDLAENENVNSGTLRNAMFMNEIRPEHNEMEKFDGTTVKVEVDSEDSEDDDHFPLKQLILYNMDFFPRRSLEKGTSSGSSEKPTDNSSNSNSKEQNKKPHIKKPLNAFMLYMKEMRAKVVAECTLKESAAINQILGRRWHALGREEQAKYYELARRERQLHMQLYPDWSSRANTQRGKKRKRKQETTDGGNNLKKCRTRYGLDQQNQWCKPCRRKKKCVRYMEALAAASGSVPVSMATPQSPCSDEDIKLEEFSDASSDGEAHTPLNSASSPGGLSALSSLASPASDPPPAPPRNPVGTNLTNNS